MLPDVQRHLRAVRYETAPASIEEGVVARRTGYRVGMDVSYLSEVENGRKEPFLIKIKELAQGLGINVSKLVQGL
jgi:transcriptional regulator with XRE-family HTH domain